MIWLSLLGFNQQLHLTCTLHITHYASWKYKIKCRIFEKKMKMEVRGSKSQRRLQRNNWDCIRLGGEGTRGDLKRNNHLPSHRWSGQPLTKYFLLFLNISQNILLQNYSRKLISLRILILEGGGILGGGPSITKLHEILRRLFFVRLNVEKAESWGITLLHRTLHCLTQYFDKDSFLDLFLQI